MSAPLGERLLSAASLVRRGSVIADIGTDHAYLPIYLLERGIAKYAYLTDINEGPLLRARENIEKSSLSKRAELFLADGATALAKLPIDDYIIAGMGGELIASIIDRAEHLKSSTSRLILQPMSKHSELREYLFSHGFDIEREVFSREDEKIYVVFLAVYRGEKIPYTDLEIFFGKNPEAAMSCEAGGLYIKSRLDALCKIIEGKRFGGVSAERERGIVKGFEEKFGQIPKGEFK